MRITCSLAFAGILLLGVGGVAATAQDNPAPSNSAQGQRAGGKHHHARDVDAQLAHMTKRLSLTSDQQNQIRPLLVAHQQKELALRQDSSLSGDELRTRAHAIREETHKQIEALLTDEQKQKAKAMEQRMHHNHRNDAPGGSGSPSSQPQGVSDPTADIG